MDKKLHTLKRTLIWGLTLAFGFFFSTANAQLSGSYTIDDGSSTGGTNFQTWSDFSSALSDGVSGAVTVTVKTDEIASSPVVFKAITGASATNTITIDGANKSLSFAGSSGSRSVIDFAGADYMTIKNLTIVNSGNYVGVRGIWFHAGSDYNTIKDNTIEFSKLSTGTSSSSTGGAYIAFTNSSTSLYSSGDHGSYNKIDGNTMTTTNGNEEGPYAGIYMMSSTTSTSGSNTIDQNEITNNTIKNFHYYGIWVRNTNGTIIKGNDISRDAVTGGNPNSTLYGIYCYYNKNQGRAFSIEDNKVHDLPYKGGKSGVSNCYGIRSSYDGYYGSMSGDPELSGNTVENCYGSGRSRGFWIAYGRDLDISNNTVKNPSQNSGEYVGMLIERCYGKYEVSGNEVQGVIMNSNYSYMYGIRIYYSYHSGDLKVENNYVYDVVNNSTNARYNYGIRVERGTTSSSNKVLVQGNRVNNVKVNYYYAYGIDVYYAAPSIIQSNLVTNIAGYFGTYGIRAYSFSSPIYTEMRQNTVMLDGTQSRQRGTAYAFYSYCYYSNRVVWDANITDLRNWGTAYHIYENGTSNALSRYKSMDYNLTYGDNNGTNRWYSRVTNNLTSHDDWKNQAATGDNELFMDPKLDKSTNPTIFETQNAYPSNASNLKDAYGDNRNMVTSDLGGVESMLDLEASSSITLPASVCSGYELPVKLDIKNTFTNSAYNIKVGYAVNGVLVRATVADTIASGGSFTYTFPTDAKFSEVGANTIQIFLSIPDDNTSNDTITLTTNVKPAPGGSEMTPSATATTALYQINRPDISQINVHTIYDFTAPRAYSNATYGADWTADAWVETSTGTILPAATVVQRDASATDGLEVDFMTSDSTLEDETLTLKVKFTDMNNGCDTILENSIFIYPTAHPDFTFLVGICDGDAVLFENTSTVLSGDLFFEWDFGTGVATDNTDAPEPVFAFPSAGTYTVTLTAKTFPYGFEQTKTYTVVVSELPTVNFTKLNACEGNDLTFTSAVTPASAVLSWDFGDGSAPSSLTNPTHQYTSTGGYTVTLSADLNGCVREETQVAYQFDKPVAAATVTSGSCDNEEIEITNNSSIANGNFGSYWDLDDAGAVSTAKDAKHQYSTPGAKNVTLTVTTDFGCEDDITVPVTVKESPKVAFTNTPACSIDPTDFSNLTPSVAGTSPTFSWNFSDGTSGAENPSHTWTGLGKKTVTFNVTLDNGCVAEVSKDLSVGVQPVVNFDAADVCAGSPAVFDNQTTWPSGDISYEWDFADAGSTSTESDPVYMYSTTATKTYVVTLTAKIAGGCEDDFQKQVTVNEGPKTCEFDFANDYTVGLRAIKLSPTGGSTVGIDYTWILGNEGSKTSADGGLTHIWQNEGPQTVTMRAKVRTTGCECSSSKEIVSSSVSVNNQLSAVVFPNPSTGDLFIKMDKAQGQSVTMTLVSLTGAAVKTQTAVNNGTMSFDANNVSNGVYLLKMVSGEKVSTVKVTLQH